MPYAPSETNQSGRILAGGIASAGDSLATALDAIHKTRQEQAGADVTMDMLAQFAPQALPKGPDGKIDMEFLNKFHSGPLKAKQAIIGQIVSQIQTPLQKAQTDYYKQSTTPAAPAVDTLGSSLGAWGGLRKKAKAIGPSSANNATQFAEPPAIPMGEPDTGGFGVLPVLPQ